MSRHIKSGRGWRLGWDASAPEFKGLAGGAEWSVELTESELDDLCRLASELADTLQVMSAELMDEERIACEAETHQVWVEVEGFPNAYDLRFILLTGRRCEGGWPAAAVPEVLQAMKTLKVF
jgi:hypothetical protein